MKVICAFSTDSGGKTILDVGAEFLTSLAKVIKT